MINVDISNIWGAVSLPDLLGLEAEVFAAHAALMEETGTGKKLLPELSGDELSRILDSADRIRSSSDVLLVLGSGGSSLGARGAMELLQGTGRNIGKGNPQIFFAGNSLSTRRWNEVLRLLEGKDFSLCVISDSGDTLESAIAFRNLRWLLERRYGTDEARKRIYTVTGKATGTLAQMAGEEGWESFAVPENLPGGFAMLTAAGLLPMAAAGIDIGSVLRGAREAKEAYDLRSYENPVWLYAAARNLMHRKGKAVELLESFEPGFRTMGLWWQQLFAGAEGKEEKGLFPAAAELPADMYGLGQFVQQGRRNLFETMLRFEPSDQKVIIGEDVRDWDGLNGIAGMSLDSAEEAVYQAVVEAHGEEAVPIISIDCPELNERTLGELIYFFELSCAVSGYVLGVNPFSRPGVERYRENLLGMLGKTSG